jgi:uncharacterized membrane protein
MSVPPNDNAEEKQQSDGPKSKELIIQEEVIRILESNGTSLPQQKVQQIAISIARSFSGPLPHPDILAEYERILPGCAHRIMTAFENQSRHRMSLESHAVQEQLSQSGRGQILGGIIVFASLGIAAWMGFLGHEVLAGTLGTTTVVSLATIYFLGKKSQYESLRSKNPKKKI